MVEAARRRLKGRARRSHLSGGGYQESAALRELDNAEVIAKYLAVALEDPNPDVFLHALADVAKARGISKVARAAGLGRESLYKALAPGAKIRYNTVRKLLNSLGVRLTVRTP